MANVKKFGQTLPNKTKVGIGIDQSLTGFAVTALNKEDPTQFYTEVYKSPYRGVQRLRDLYDYLRTFMQNYVVEDVAMEGTVLASHSALVLGELAATVKLCLLDNFDILPLQVPPMTLKKFASGKGTSKKQEMLLQIFKRYGVEFNDDNAADSYGLSRIAAGIEVSDIEASILVQLEDEKYRDSVINYL
jgi:crossover junction endodeoxyribonuclease RuvC